MLQQVLAAIPKIFVAIVVLGITYMVARVIGDLVARLLANAGFDGWLPGSAWARSPRRPR